MTRHLYVIILAAFLTTSAAAQLTTLIESVEASTRLINLPATQSGRLTFKPCSEECDSDYISVRLTANTRFISQGTQVEFKDFRRDFFNNRYAQRGYALVSYDTEKSTATSVEISY